MVVVSMLSAVVVVDGVDGGWTSRDGLDVHEMLVYYGAHNSAPLRPMEHTIPRRCALRNTQLRAALPLTTTPPGLVESAPPSSADAIGPRPLGCLAAPLSVGPPVCPSVCRSVGLSVCPSVCLFGTASRLARGGCGPRSHTCYGAGG